MGAVGAALGPQRRSREMSRMNYKAAYEAFDLGIAGRVLSKGLGPGLNACFECCDRHAMEEPDAPALFYESDDRSTILTFGELQSKSAAFADFLARQNIGPGDCVAALVPRGCELVIAAVATWRLGAVFLPLFTAFGETAIDHRLRHAEARLLVVDEGNRDKLSGLDHLPTLVTVSKSGPREGEFDFWTELNAASPHFGHVGLTPESPFLRMFTSGTTGKPKSLDVPLRALVAFAGYMREGIGLTTEDRFWNLADPGWAYGLYYALIGPLLLGHSTTFYSGAFAAEKAIGIIRRRGITNLAGSPTAFRLFMVAGPKAVMPIKNQLRVVSSAGEPLPPEISRWFQQNLGVAIHDHYGQTELGMVVANHNAFDNVDPAGSAGFPCPGYRVALLDDSGSEVGAGIQGEMAIDRLQSPLFWFQGYREATPVSDRYYRTGDAAEWCSDGSLSFVGRTDDVITSSGYRIGPFDVESALAEHPAVLEAAVIGKPDPDRTEIVKAFVVLKPEAGGTPALAENLKQHVRKRLSAHAYPREIEFMSELPKTPSGKVQRFLLRSR